MNPAIFDKPSAAGALLGVGDIATPTAGYSLRYLSINYIGQPVVRVRKDVVGNPEQDFTPNQLTDGTLASFADGNDCFVSKWYDQFGSNDATNSTAAEQPKIWDASTGLVTENGKPAVEFDGVDDYIVTSNNFIANTDLSLFILHKFNSLTSKPQDIVSQGASSNSQGFKYGMSGVGSNQLVIYLTSGNVIYTDDSSTIFQELHSLINTSSTATLNINSINESLSLSGSAGSIGNNNDPLTIGKRDSSNIYYVGKIQELIIYTSDQSANRTKIEDNINVYYVLYGLKHYRQRVLADSGTFALEGRDALVYNSVTIPEMPSLICSCDAYKATKLYNINPA